jgi:hypothetical protein
MAQVQMVAISYDGVCPRCHAKGYIVLQSWVRRTMLKCPVCHGVCTVPKESVDAMLVGVPSPDGGP